jgi:transcriptional regulator of aromatic amino acid metabolism
MRARGESPQIAAASRRSKRIRNIEKKLAHTKDPLVLPGDPGSGKTLTLQQAHLSARIPHTHAVPQYNHCCMSFALDYEKMLFPDADELAEVGIKRAYGLCWTCSDGAQE